MTVWWTLGFNTIIYLAGPQDISTDLYEAAEVDGAGTWQKFRNVTLPGMRPVVLFVLTMTILASANMFGQSYLVSQGPPANETRTAIMYIAQTGLGEFRQGAAAAMGLARPDLHPSAALDGQHLLQDRRRRHQLSGCRGSRTRPRPSRASRVRRRRWP